MKRRRPLRGWFTAGRLIVLVTLANSVSAVADGSPLWGLGVGIGGLWKDVSHLTATESDGGAGITGTFVPVVQVQTHLRWERFFIQPTLFYGLTSASAIDDSLSQHVWGFLLQGGVRPFPFPIDLKLGIGNLFYRLHGKGGDVVLDNGDGVSTFSYPERTVSSRLFFLSLGAGLTYPSLPQLRTELDLLIHQLGSSERRGFDLLFTLGWAGSW